LLIHAGRLAHLTSRFPDIAYFRDPDIQMNLTNVLFLYSVTHPSIGYRQGMHELLAPLYFAVDFDSIAPETDPLADNPTLLEFCSRSWVAADAWALFDAVMRGVSRWYEWQESPRPPSASPLATHVHLNVADGPSDFKPYVAPIVQDCNRVQSVLLKSVDPTLFNSMHGAGIEPQIYGM
jgi:TBC1 domain family protein 5